MLLLLLLLLSSLSLSLSLLLLLLFLSVAVFNVPHFKLGLSRFFTEARYLSMGQLPCHLSRTSVMFAVWGIAWIIAWIMDHSLVRTTICLGHARTASRLTLLLVLCLCLCPCLSFLFSFSFGLVRHWGASTSTSTSTSGVGFKEAVKALHMVGNRTDESELFLPPEVTFFDVKHRFPVSSF